MNIQEGTFGIFITSLPCQQRLCRPTAIQIISTGCLLIHSQRQTGLLRVYSNPIKFTWMRASLSLVTLANSSRQ